VLAREWRGMAQTKREIYERKRAYLQELADAREAATNGEVPECKDYPFVAQKDAQVALEWCDGYDDENAITSPNDADSDANRWGSTRAPSTLRQWLISVIAFARDLDGSILEASGDDLNQVAQRMYEGEAASVTKPLSKNSIRAHQNCIKKFLRHGDADADPEEITVFDKQSTVVDPEDMLTKDEFHALRKRRNIRATRP